MRTLILLCDYLETDLVEFDNGEYRRNYVRQHPIETLLLLSSLLWRSFGQKGFDGMDALRWMLGHSDMEHLYITISLSQKLGRY